MITYSGKRVFPEHDVRHVGESPTLEDIAIGLGRQSRFAGQTYFFYTVLCHVLVAAQLVEPKYRIHVLLHDAAEAIMGDVPTTWKPDAFVEFEGQIIELIYEYYGLSFSNAADAAVHAADRAALAGEAHALGHALADEYWPRDEMNGMARRAEVLTYKMLQDGKNRSYIDPRTAVNDFLSAMWVAAGDEYDARVRVVA